MKFLHRALLITTHWEHRYLISGASLLAAMGQSSQVPYADALSVRSGDFALTHVDDKEQSDGAYVNVKREKMKNNLDSSDSQVNDETLHRADERSGGVHQTVDVAEIISHWTRGLQRIHKQSLHMVKVNECEGPEFLRSVQGSSSCHTESLSATLAEHQQHLVSFEVLINQLKKVATAIQKSISECTDKVDGISSYLAPMTKHPGRSTSPIQAAYGMTLDCTDDVAEVTSNLSTIQLEEVTASLPALKLPQLFSVTHNSHKRLAPTSQISQKEKLSERKLLEPPLSNNHIDNLPQDSDSHYVQN